MRVLCLGLDGAGKTSVLLRAADATATLEGVEPTNGFKVRTVIVEPNCRAEVWDIGGGQNLRPYWSRYATPETDGLMWVLDGTDAARFTEACDALHDVLRRSILLRSLPLLVLVTKADLAAAGAVPTAEEASVGLGLDALKQERLALGPHLIQVVSAVDGRNLAKALKWMMTSVHGEPAQERT
jgi:GTPase SAR1 family protein